MDPAFLPILEAIQITLPAQLEAINELARSGDWGSVQRRLGNELKPIESQTAVLVESIDRQARGELTGPREDRKPAGRDPYYRAGHSDFQFCIAAFLGWSVARRIIELRLNERVSERLRIAHELHDTLLQTIQASMMIAAGALESPGDAIQQRRALEKLSIWLGRAEREGRAALSSLHASATERNDLAEAFQRAIEDCRTQTAAEVVFSVAGLATEMHPTCAR